MAQWTQSWPFKSRL